jgi:ABC-2 type transport system permease protein
VSPARVACVVAKEFRQLRRDPLALRLTLIAPLLQLVLLGYAATLDVRQIPSVICDLDRSAASRHMLRAVLQSGYFEEQGRVERPESALAWLDRGRAAVALIVPAGYARRLSRGERPALQALVDGTNSTYATTALAHLSGIVLTESIDLAVQRLPAELSGARRGPPVTLELRAWYNEKMVSSHFMVPGVIALILLVTTMLLTAVALTREKEIGTLEQLLVTPIRASELLVGKLLPYALLGMLHVGVVLAVGRFWFGVPLRGSLWLLLALAAAFLLTTLGSGLLAASISSTQQQALLLSIGIVMPNMLLSGFIFPIENMPRAIQGLTLLVPLRYFLTIIRGILLKGNGLDVLWPQAAALLALGVAIFLASLAAFGRRAGG